jgi:hypothetical protein
MAFSSFQNIANFSKSNKKKVVPPPTIVGPIGAFDATQLQSRVNPINSSSNGSATFLVGNSESNTDLRGTYIVRYVSCWIPKNPPIAGNPTYYGSHAFMKRPSSYVGYTQYLAGTTGTTGTANPTGRGMPSVVDRNLYQMSIQTNSVTAAIALIYNTPSLPQTPNYATENPNFSATCAAWIQIECPKAFVLTYYKLLVVAAPDSHPNEWHMCGSNDGGGTNTCLDYRYFKLNDVNFPHTTSAANGEPSYVDSTWSITLPSTIQSYNTYRFCPVCSIDSQKLGKNKGGNIRVASLQLYGYFP